MRRSRSTITCCSRPTRGRASRSTIRGGSGRSTSCRRTGSTSGRRSRRSGPSRSGWTSATFTSALSGRIAAIKLLLGDQRIVAGLGNIYVCEALYRAGIHPKRAGGSVSLDRLKRLVGAIEEVLAEAIEAGGSSLKDFASPDGELGYFSKSFAVYDREGQPCACGGTVKRIVQGGRSTFYCPQCQRYRG